MISQNDVPNGCCVCDKIDFNFVFCLRGALSFAAEGDYGIYSVVDFELVTHLQAPKGVYKLLLAQ